MARSALVAVSPESAAVRIASVIAFAWVGSRPASVRRRAMVNRDSFGELRFGVVWENMGE